MLRSRCFILLACVFASAACSRVRTTPAGDAGIVTATATASASGVVDAGRAAQPPDAGEPADAGADAAVEAGKPRPQYTSLGLTEHNVNTFCQQKGYYMLTGHTCLKLCRSESECGTGEECKSYDKGPKACWPK
jgi:hypothetical protein